MASACTIQILHIGRGKHPVVVIDGLCDEPERWRSAATASEFTVLGDFYPGRRCLVPREYLTEVAPLFERIGVVPYRFNRPVLYPSNLLHYSANGSDAVLPDDPLHGRLTVAAFMLAR